MSAHARQSRRGAPLAMLCVLLSAWVAGRAALWEGPTFLDGGLTEAARSAVPFALERDRGSQADGLAGLSRVTGERRALPANDARPARSGFAGTGSGVQRIWTGGSTGGGGGERGFDLASARFARGGMGNRVQSAPRAAPPPFAPPLLPAPRDDAPDALPGAGRTPDRWALDAWAFVREGSRSAPIAQTRSPIYGASQAGARLSYRLAPSAARDPRAFVRAYHAMVPNGESEVALGLSARPVARAPLRAVAELRATDDPGGSELRPAALVFTEIAPIALPGKATLEAYGAAGYVGGRADTAFADGQVAVLRPVARGASAPFGSVALSVGAGAWGGAQRGAERLDVGPSVRLDMRIAEVPARLSLDYRLQVAGDAAPGSGLAATLSTRF